MHRDLKLENIIINEETLKITIIDFGLSCKFEKGWKIASEFCGSIIYMAPEILL